jgi:hypothetical protein
MQLLAKTDTVAVAAQLFWLSTTTVYISGTVFATLLTVGFCWEELNPLGPDQAKETPPDAVSPTLLPLHTGALLDAIAFGDDFTTTEAVAVPIQPLVFVAVTV